MPPIGVELDRNSSGPQVRALHEQLQALGTVLESSERDGAKFGPSTTAAVRAFRARYGLPAGDSLDLPTGRLMYVVSRFSAGTDRTNLRAVVAEAAAAVGTHDPEERYWLARYAVMAGDYQTARTLANGIIDHAGVKTVIDPVLALPVHLAPPDPNQPPLAPPLRQPEVPYPENFYSYRRPWVDPAAVDRVAAGWSALTNEQVNPLQHAGGPAAIAALRSWHQGNARAFERRYADAVAAYEACQESVVIYFDNFYPDIALRGATSRERLAALLRALYVQRDKYSAMWDLLDRRRELLALTELEAHDRIVPGDVYDSALNFASRQLGDPTNEQAAAREFRQRNLDAPLITLAFVLAPLARAEANRARRQYDAAVSDIQSVVVPRVVRTIAPPRGEGGPIQQIRMRLANEFIEAPFATLLLAETLLEKADAEYKARTAAAPVPDVAAYQGLKAAQTYLEIKTVLAGDGAYVAHVEAGREALKHDIEQRLVQEDTRSAAFHLLGNDISVPTLTSSSATLPGLDRRLKAHEPLLRVKRPGEPADAGGPAPLMRETNPRVYAVLLTTEARLEQLKAGFNYLGYSDSYVPPWRFQFLLERARYFAEHAKNAQRDYLNFLANAEREEFQELSAAQNVEMEKSNIRVDTARVELARMELAAAEESRQLALLTARNAETRMKDFAAFDQYVDRLFGIEALRQLNDPWQILEEKTGVSALPGPRDVPLISAAGTMLTDFWGRGAASQAKERVAADAQREQELKSLQLAADEARQAATVAKRQVATAQAGLNLAALQRQAALLRHEHAAQNLEFLRHRSLNAEQWFRLAEGVRSVSQTYLRYSIELAFLAEQAYEFEADKRINVIRFDYDLSDVGDYLAADFLLRDLDTLEQDLIVTQRQRQQHVRYVLSMARECPEALKEVRESGSAIFTVRLEQLEKRHPGLYNLRIGAVDVEPIALIDATRFSMELTHLGTSHVRLKASPDMPSGQASPSPLNTNELTPPPGGWLAALAATWPVKLRITAPEAVVFSGLSRTDAAAVFSFAAASQRQPFDGLGAASSWRVDLSARDNQVVPGSLADVLIAFTLSGYHDAALRHAVDTAPRPMMAGSRWLSGRSNFPDALYEFHRSGRMVWNVPHRLLALTDRLGTVRNVGVALSPMASVQGTVMGRVMNRWQLRLRIMPAGELKVLTDIPTLGFELGEQATALVLTARADFAAGAPARVTWDFGDGSPRAEGLTAQHTYAKPGRYIVTAHAHRDGRLLQLRAHVVAARAHRARMVSPVTAFPRLTRGAGGDVPAGHTRVVGEVVAPADDPVSGNWRIGDRSHTNVNRAVFDLTPGDYTLAFSAVRPLKGRLSCTQRQPEGPPLAFDGLRLSSNRRFDEDGVETTGVGSNPPANPLTVHLFMDALSPADEWTLELPADVNPCLRTISSSDVEQFGLPEIEDVVLVLEYDATPS